MPRIAIDTMGGDQAPGVPIAGAIRNIGVPVKLSDTPGSVRHAAPVLGAHTDAVLSQFGFSESDIAEFKESGAAGVTA